MSAISTQRDLTPSLQQKNSNSVLKIEDGSLPHALWKCVYALFYSIIILATILTATLTAPTPLSGLAISAGLLACGATVYACFHKYTKDS